MKQARFILKVLIISTGLSALIKYGGPTAAIVATPTNVLAIVFVPALIVAIALLWRTLKTRQLN